MKLDPERTLLLKNKAKEAAGTLSRRKLLTTSGVLVLAGGGLGAFAVSSYSTEAYLRMIVSHLLRNDNISSESLSRFSHDFFSDPRHSVQSEALKRIIVFTSANVAGYKTLREEPLFKERIAAVERDVIDLFLSGSDFFQLLDNTQDPITYIGQNDFCPNPFARFLNPDDYPQWPIVPSEP